MHKPFLLAAALAVLAAAATAQTPTQATGSVQSAVPVAPVERVAPARSISVEGLTPSAAGPLDSTAPDSGPQQWKDVMGWISLKPGMLPDEVHALLGMDYRETVNATATLWTYQDQKALLFGSVSFRDGRLESWTSPRF